MDRYDQNEIVMSVVRRLIGVHLSAENAAKLKLAIDAATDPVVLCATCKEPIPDGQPYASIGGNIVPYIPAKLYHIQCVPVLDPYSVGQQPCQNLKRQAGNIPAAPEMPNVHECYRCGGRVSFCENCHRDHHERGYEYCVANAVLASIMSSGLFNRECQHESTTLTPGYVLSTTPVETPSESAEWLADYNDVREGKMSFKTYADKWMPYLETPSQ